MLLTTDCCSSGMSKFRADSCPEKYPTLEQWQGCFCIYVECQKTKTKRKILKGAREKRHVSFK